MIVPRVIAHRGSSAAHPDNSWAAFRSAVAEGADGIECDVQSTADGVLVVRHDLTVESGLMRRKELVCEMSIDELEAARRSTIRFGDLLGWLERETIGLLVEVKDPGAAKAVAMVVSASPARERIVVGGFHGPALSAVKAACPTLRTSIMVGSVLAPEELVHIATAYHADGVHLCWETRAPHPHRLIDANAIDRLRRAGLTTTLWHEERASELRALVALEPDAICTNTPSVLRSIVQGYLARGDAGRANAAVTL